MSRYEAIRQGLLEAIAYEKGKEKETVIVRTMSINEIKTFTPEEIKQIRINANMTQSVFASCIGVTKKAIEAWEGGRSKPDGAARRTLGLMEKNPRFADEVGIIIR